MAFRLPRFTTAQAITISFLGLILAGALLLSLPWASSPGKTTRFVDAPFTVNGTPSGDSADGTSVAEPKDDRPAATRADDPAGQNRAGAPTGRPSQPKRD